MCSWTNQCREFAMNGVEGNGGTVFSAPIGYGMGAPSTPPTDTVVTMYGDYTIAGDTFPVMKCDTGLTHASISRKRSRDAIISRGGGFTFLGEDISFQIQHQQLEIDRFIAQHTEKVRTEIEERRKRCNRRIAAAVEENAMRKLKSREEEIQKIGKLNYALEERVRSLCAENQIWRDLAESSEATANALRSNLERVLAQVQEEQRADSADDGDSCCGSNFEEGDRRTLAEGHDRDGCIAPMHRVCRSCEREESCVLLLPCRHLCLCTICGSTLHTCPVCNATKTASVHVNLHH